MMSDVERARGADERCVERQLGNERTRVWGIARRCPHGFPSIVVLNCMDKAGKLDPGVLATPLYLTCPYLNERIHAFETGGYVSSIAYLISSDREIHGMMMDSHAHYYFFRKEVYRACAGKTPGDEVIRFLDKGIGGMSDIYGLKCLHLHYSHYAFCSYNVAGMIVARLLGGDIACADRRCERF